MADLGEQDCEIIIMRHYEQLSNQEVAEALGLTEAAASMRYLRAIRRLRTMLYEPPSRSGNPVNPELIIPSTHADFAADADRDQRLARLLAELTDAVQRGQAVDLDAVCRQHADLAHELRQLWGAVLVADAAGSHSRNEASGPAQETPSGTLELPCRLGGYELLEELGRGGMGVVYRARQLGLDREVAVKMILRGQLASPPDRERFRAEAEAAARLDHPNIVPVYEVGEAEGRPFFSMKYIAGQTLSQVLAEHPLPAREAARILAAVSRAIHFAHQKGVLHRDLKPSNILIDAEGEPHVTDFGLAKRITEPVSLTKSGAILGTPSYMAPEQAAGARGEVGPASDVYSLGAILYHMLTGRPPFQAATPVDTVLLVLEQDPVPPRVINPKADRDLEMIALRCLQKPADLRYASAESLADDLEAYLHDEPISARSGRFAQVLSRLFRETHHAAVLENWGLLWMWHSLVAVHRLCPDRPAALGGLGRTLVLHHPVDGRLGHLGGRVLGAAPPRGPGDVCRAADRSCLGLQHGRHRAAVLPGTADGLARADPVARPGPDQRHGVLCQSRDSCQARSTCRPSPCLPPPLRWRCFPSHSHLIFGTVAALCFFIPGWKYYRQRGEKESAASL